MRLEVATTITDLAGNPLPTATSFMWNLSAWANRTGGYTVGGSPQLPAVAQVGDAIFVATSVTGASGRRIAVIDAAGQAIGAVLGTSNAVAPAITGTTDGTAVVAWEDTTTGTIEAARWDGSTWAALPSPGGGTRAALATSPGGVIGLAWITATGSVAAARLVNNAWPHDPRISLETRVRGYIASNCSHCHNPAGERSAQDFRIGTPLASTGLCSLVVPGDAAASRIFQRVSSRPGMPPIATLQTDPLIVDVMADWITGMTSCP